MDTTKAALIGELPLMFGAYGLGSMAKLFVYMSGLALGAKLLKLPELATVTPSGLMDGIINKPLIDRKGLTMFWDCWPLLVLAGFALSFGFALLTGKFIKAGGNNDTE